MAIADTITSMQTHTSNAYTMIGYGTDLTGINKNLENLSTSIFNAFLEALRNPDTLFTNLPKKSGTGANITLNDTANAPMRIELGSRVLEQATSILPSEYQQVEYIENLNNRYFDTGFKPNNNTKVEAVASINELTNSGKFLFATRNSGRTDIFCGLIWTDNKVAGGYGNSGLYQSEVVQNIDEKFTLTLDKNLLYHNGTLLQTFSTQTFTSENNLYLFTANTAGSPDSQVFRGKLYFCKIYDNGTLVRDFIPCYKISDNTIGLYDIVNNVFYANLGSGTIQKGSNTILPNPNYPQDIHTISGSNTIKVEGKNLFDKNGTFTKPYDYWLLPIKLKNNTKYTISSTLTGTAMTNVVVGIVPYGERYTDFATILIGTINYGTGATVNATFTTNNTWTSPKIVVFASNQTILESIFDNYNIQLELGNQVTTYTPYVSQEADIDLDTIEYCKIGNYEDKFIRTSGKNLIDMSKATYGRYVNHSTGNTGGYANVYATDYIEVEAGKQYYFSGMKTLNGGNTGAMYNENKEYVSGIVSDSDIRPMAIPNNVKYIRLSIWTNNYNDPSNPEPMLAQSSTEVPYEPYGSNEWYIKKNIGKVVLNGTEDWSDFSVGDTNFRCQYDTALPNILTPPSNPAVLLCNYFAPANRDNVYAKTQVGIAQYGSTLGKIFFCAPNSILSEQTLNGWKTWLNTHNLIVNYLYATPTYTQITGTLAEQLENVYKKMLSYTGQTNISQVNNDLAFELSVSAIEEM